MEESKHKRSGAEAMHIDAKKDKIRGVQTRKVESDKKEKTEEHKELKEVRNDDIIGFDVKDIAKKGETAAGKSGPSEADDEKKASGTEAQSVEAPTAGKKLSNYKGENKKGASSKPEPASTEKSKSKKEPSKLTEWTNDFKRLFIRKKKKPEPVKKEPKIKPKADEEVKPTIEDKKMEEKIQKETLSNEENSEKISADIQAEVINRSELKEEEQVEGKEVPEIEPTKEDEIVSSSVTPDSTTEPVKNTDALVECHGTVDPSQSAGGEEVKEDAQAEETDKASKRDVEKKLPVNPPTEELEETIAKPDQPPTDMDGSVMAESRVANMPDAAGGCEGDHVGVGQEEERQASKLVANNDVEPSSALRVDQTEEEQREVGSDGLEEKHVDKKKSKKEAKAAASNPFLSDSEKEDVRSLDGLTEKTADTSSKEEGIDKDTSKDEMMESQDRPADSLASSKEAQPESDIESSKNIPGEKAKTKDKKNFFNEWKNDIREFFTLGKSSKGKPVKKEGTSKKGKPKEDSSADPPKSEDNSSEKSEKPSSNQKVNNEEPSGKGAGDGKTASQPPDDSFSESREKEDPSVGKTGQEESNDTAKSEKDTNCQNAESQQDGCHCTGRVVEPADPKCEPPVNGSEIRQEEEATGTSDAAKDIDKCDIGTQECCEKTTGVKQDRGEAVVKRSDLLTGNNDSSQLSAVETVQSQAALSENQKQSKKKKKNKKKDAKKEAGEKEDNGPEEEGAMQTDAKVDVREQTGAVDPDDQQPAAGKGRRKRSKKKRHEGDKRVSTHSDEDEPAAGHDRPSSNGGGGGGGEAVSARPQVVVANPEGIPRPRKVDRKAKRRSADEPQVTSSGQVTMESEEFSKAVESFDKIYLEHQEEHHEDEGGAARLAQQAGKSQAEEKEEKEEKEEEEEEEEEEPATQRSPVVEGNSPIDPSVIRNVDGQARQRKGSAKCRSGSSRSSWALSVFLNFFFQH